MPLTRRKFLTTGVGAALALCLPGWAERALAAPRQAITAIFHGRRDVPQVCLTYDDMWDEAVSLKIAEAFAEKDIKVTFFPAGLAIRANINTPTAGHENLYQRIYEMGHEFGCHTYSHIDITDLTARDLVDSQIQTWIEVMNDALGFEYQPVALRPPMGIVTNALFDAAYETDLPIVLWSADMRDSFCAPDQCEAELSWRFGVLLKNGEIFLQHTTEGSLAVINQQLELLDEMKLSTVLLSEMLAVLNGEIEVTPEAVAEVEVTPEVTPGAGESTP
jgi:peptidoglycan/xylan/chitin deacetylase (PgdA/CDA1 family)